ncbi:hypothetical protein [Nakamurella panacisegetis]|uniref:hypothetical protein n=1 Tax=Nakamurella panacisegetis TaxID=1090615 RepID=UPI000B848C5E|nr:hypothetical protein [Nakamurella panacisegetis]
MFDRQQVLAELRRTVGIEPLPAFAAPGGPAPVGSMSVGTAAAGSVLAVPAPLVDVLPRGGLPRGGVVSLVGDGGSTSLLFALLAAPSNAWSALVGLPDLALLAAAEQGVDLDRLVVIPDPGPDVLQVLSVLADGVDIIAAVPPKVLPPARLRVLGARLRQSGAVLLAAGPWPGAELVLRSRIENWTGIGRGHGRLRDRELVVEVSGRGAARGRGSVAMLLRSTRSTVTPVPRIEPVALPLVAEVG